MKFYRLWIVQFTLNYTGYNKQQGYVICEFHLIRICRVCSFKNKIKLYMLECDENNVK